MDEFEMRRIIYDYIKEICHYSQMQVFATSSYQKNYFQMQIDETINALMNFFVVNYSQRSGQLKTEEQQESPQSEVREITREELEQNNGSEGKPAYVAVNGNVYNVSQVLAWAGGTHFGLFAGKELSSEFITCHTGMEAILHNLPIVGVLKQS